jgi:hypothetical protein
MGHVFRKSPLGIYRFHVRDAFGVFEDEEGIDLPDLYAALREALLSVHELLADVPSATEMQFEIADDTGCVVLVVPITTEASEMRGSRVERSAQIP